MYNRGGRGGYSFYGQKMTFDKNDINNNRNNNQRINHPNNNYPNFNGNNNNNVPVMNIPKKYNNYDNNLNQNKYNPNNKIPMFQNNIPLIDNNQKYPDLKLKTYFSKNGEPVLNSADIELNKGLETITNQYMTIFDNINILSKNNNNKNNNQDQINKLNNIKKEINQVDYHNGNEYSNFIGQLYEVSKKDEVLNLGYDMYKQDKIKGDENFKKIIDQYKYEIVLLINKDNTTRQNYDKLNDYILRKKAELEPKNNILNNNPAPHRKNTDDDFNLFNDNDDDDKNNKYPMFNNNNNQFRPNNNNNVANNTNRGYYNNDINSDEEDNNNYIDEKPKFNIFEDPNKIDDINIPAKKLNVKFLIDGNEACHVFNSEDTGEGLLLYAMQEVDDPKLYTQDGKELNFENLSKIKIKDLFGNSEPYLIVQ